MGATRMMSGAGRSGHSCSDGNQRKIARSSSQPAGAVPALVRETLASGGEPLDAATRNRVEPAFGWDFSKIRIHANARASASALAIGADAYSYGGNIVFAPGRYAPRSPNGMRLLTHELAHSVQDPVSAGPPRGIGAASHPSEYFAEACARAMLQGRPLPHASGAPAGDGQVRRSLTVLDSAGKPPAAATTTLATNAALAESWITEMCPTGGWKVDATSGAVSNPKRDDVCAAAATSSTPESCKCLCDVTASAGPDVRVRVADKFKIGSQDVDVVASGQGATLKPQTGHPEYNVGVTGRSNSVSGAGDTSPVSGSGGAQRIRDQPWIIFAHEICGHILTGSDAHYQTAGGKETAVDIENRIRREHSTVASSLGIRKGNFRADEDSTGLNSIDYSGSSVSPLAGEKVPALARRLGIATIPGHIFTVGGEWIPVKDAATFDPKDGAFAVNVYYHDVIAGETTATISALWGVPETSLVRANPTLAKSKALSPGNRLIVPAS